MMNEKYAKIFNLFRVPKVVFLAFWRVLFQMNGLRLCLRLKKFNGTHYRSLFRRTQQKAASALWKPPVDTSKLRFCWTMIGKSSYYCVKLLNNRLISQEVAVRYKTRFLSGERKSVRYLLLAKQKRCWTKFAPFLSLLRHCLARHEA